MTVLIFTEYYVYVVLYCVLWYSNISFITDHPVLFAAVSPANKTALSTFPPVSVG